MSKPVYQENGKWYHWDEADCNSFGPFDTMPEALDSYLLYMKEVRRYNEMVSNRPVK